MKTGIQERKRRAGEFSPKRNLDSNLALSISSSATRRALHFAVAAERRIRARLAGSIDLAREAGSAAASTTSTPASAHTMAPEQIGISPQGAEFTASASWLASNPIT